jgi:hypothetical protein
MLPGLTSLARVCLVHGACSGQSATGSRSGRGRYCPRPNVALLELWKQDPTNDCAQGRDSRRGGARYRSARVVDAEALSAAYRSSGAACAAAVWDPRERLRRHPTAAKCRPAHGRDSSCRDRAAYRDRSRRRRASGDGHAAFPVTALEMSGKNVPHWITGQSPTRPARRGSAEGTPRTRRAIERRGRAQVGQPQSAPRTRDHQDR